MGSIALIACSNGLGHARRCLLIADALDQRGEDVTVFLAPEAIERFGPLGLIGDRVGTVPFSTGSPATLAVSKYDSDWTTKLPSLQGYDLVVSDNLIEILSLRADAILSGGFLWHEALVDLPSGYRDAMKALLKCHRPRMMTFVPFDAPYLDEVADIQRFGLVVSAEEIAARAELQSERRDLLISVGLSGLANGLGEAALATAWKHGIPNALGEEAVLWIDPVLKGTARDQAHGSHARFDAAMYRRTVAAVIRPGVGTATECLAAGVRPFCIYEDGNEEMRFNARRLVELGLGEDFGSDAESAVLMASAYIDDPKRQTAHFQALAQLSFRGAADAAAYLSTLIGSRSLLGSA